MLWIGTDSASWLIRSLNTSSGAAANGAASAFSTLKLNSGKGVSSHEPGLCLQVAEEPTDCFPYLCAAGKAAPIGADQADKLVAFVDRRYIVLSGFAHSIYQERFDVR